MNPLNSEEFINYLGLREDDPVLIAMLTELGAPTGLVKEPDLYSTDVSLKRDGMNFVFEDERMVYKLPEPLGGPYLLVALHLFSEKYQGFSGYKGKLPSGLFFLDSRLVVQQKLGTPAKSGGGKKVGRRLIPVWDLYDYSKYSVHLTYNDNLESVVLVTLSANIPAK